MPRGLMASMFAFNKHRVTDACKYEWLCTMSFMATPREHLLDKYEGPDGAAPNANVARRSSRAVRMGGGDSKKNSLLLVLFEHVS